MRTLVDIPGPDLDALDRLGRRRGVSRAKVIRQAIRDYLARSGQDEGASAFGAWKDRGEDGLDYQRRIRAEW
jgi:metal-responsive CopG/Arc/MetJ family transcriptional regulator